MKKLYQLILTISAILLTSCSAERQLAVLLAKHPELHQDTVIKIDTLLIHKGEEKSIDFTINDLLALEDTTNQALEPTNNSTTTAQSSGISVDTKSSKATITPNANGSFSLKLKNKNDTVIIHDSIKQKIYITQKVYKDKIVYKMKPFQQTFFWIGIIISLLIVTSIVIKSLS